MHGLTPISLFGATTSLLVSPALIYVMWRARRGHGLRPVLFIAPLLFEAAFIVSYMTFEIVAAPESARPQEGLDVALGAMHGIFALLAFVVFWTLVPLVLRAQRRGVNFFAAHGATTWSAVAIRALALVTGELIFVLHLVR